MLRRGGEGLGWIPLVPADPAALSRRQKYAGRSGSSTQHGEKGVV